MIQSSLQRWPMEKSKFDFVLYTCECRICAFSLNALLNSSTTQQTDIQQLTNAQMLAAQKQPQQLIENNNNQLVLDPAQKRRLSRSQENNNKTLPLDNNHTKSPNDSHYIKNKTLQSPVNRYKVCPLVNSHDFRLILYSRLETNTTSENVFFISFSLLHLMIFL